MDATSPLPSAPADLPEDAALARALDSLVTEGVLTEEQASRVASARADEIARIELAHPGAPPPQAPVDFAPATSASASGAPSRLPEVLGYLGGTFVVVRISRTESALDAQCRANAGKRKVPRIPHRVPDEGRAGARAKRRG